MLQVLDHTKKRMLKPKEGLAIAEAKTPGTLHAIVLRTSSSTVEGRLELDNQTFPFDPVELNASGLTAEKKIADWRCPRFNLGSATALAFTPKDPLPYESYKLHVTNLGTANISINHLRILREVKGK